MLSEFGHMDGPHGVRCAAGGGGRVSDKDHHHSTLNLGEMCVEACMHVLYCTVPAMYSLACYTSPPSTYAR